MSTRRLDVSSRSYSVVVITVDFDSTDTGSNPVRTFFIYGVPGAFVSGSLRLHWEHAVKILSKQVCPSG